MGYSDLKEYRRENLRRRFVMTVFGSKLFSFPHIYKLRLWAYRKMFDIGKKVYIEHNVMMSRAHGLRGSIRIGNQVVLCRNVYIDYSGEVVLKDRINIAADVVIESHHRDLEAFKVGKDVNIPTRLVIEDGVYFGLKAIILSTCNYIGKNARIGAGAVVLKDVPDYATVVGVPAKVVKLNTPNPV